MNICPTTFRRTVGAFPTGVAVVTTKAPDGVPVGITISSFSSLSLEPPQILFCLSKNAHSLSLFSRGRAFAVNVLSSSQSDLSDHFATPAARRVPTHWEDVCREVHQDTDCFLLKGTLAHIVCNVSEIYEGGDHKIIIGQVVDLIRHEEESEPLVRHLSAYRKLTC